MPYSEIESLRRTASSRSATLCCFEPVKWWSRLPYESGGTTRRSKRSPSLATTVAFVLPLATISSTHGSCVKWSISATGSLAVAMMSRSRTCSLRRRTLPASLTWSAAGCSRRSATTARTAGSARPSSGFCSIFFFGVASALRTFSSVLGPSPVSVRSCSVSAAFFRSSSVSTPSSFQMRRAVFGPRPGEVHELDDVRRRFRAPASRAPRSGRLRRSGRSSPRSSCRFRTGPSPCRRARAARSSRRFPACAEPRAGTRGGGTDRCLRAPGSRPGGRTGPRRLRSGGVSSPPPR